MANVKAPLSASARMALRNVADIQARTVSLEAELERWVYVARRNGASWDDVGMALGISKQAAWTRYSNGEEDQ
jgi:hypothetical protein